MAQFFVRGAPTSTPGAPWVAVGEEQLLADLAAPCSFCGRGSTTLSCMGAAVGRAVRICQHCVALAADILIEESLREAYPLAPRAPGPEPERPASLVDLERQLQAVAETFPGWSVPEEMERARRFVQENPPRSARDFPSELVCGFCECHQREVAKLIAGKRAYICDACVVTLSGVLPDDASPRPDAREVRGPHVPLSERLARATRELAQDASDARSWRKVAELYEQTGDVVAAGQAFLRAAKLARDEDMLLVALGLFTRAVRLDPELGEAKESIAEIEARLGLGTAGG